MNGRLQAQADPLKAPFFWFGGKRRVASLVWEALGDVDNYVEPFAGSLAVLLARPGDHEVRCETVNDKDRFLANFWRALSRDPEAVAQHADWPVNEADLFSRHMWLVQHGAPRLAERLEADPDWCDAKIAGWWVWGQCAWIGSGWCSGTGPWRVEDGVVVNGTAGQGVNRKLPHLGNAGVGVNRKLPHFLDPGQGINRKRPDRCSVEQGCMPRNEALIAYFYELAARLAAVRVCCGDWARVVTNGALTYGATVGVFLDPPYLGAERTGNLYATDDHHIAAEVRDWAIAHGDDKRLRIVLAGYEPEHEAHMPGSWRRHRYSASKAYGSCNGHGRNEENRHKEMLWFSPGCLTRQGSLFGD